MMKRILLGILFVQMAAVAEPTKLAPVGGTTFRLCDGVTILVNNPKGAAFTLGIDVRDLNLFENGPREVLLKVYDPDGKTMVREIIPDDGVVTPVSQSPMGGWDHEGWYYLYQSNRGAPSMLKWSGLAAPDRLAAIPARVIERKIPAGPAGAYRVVIVGTRDHVASVRVDPALSWAVAANPYFLHPVGDRLKKSFIYVPRGTTGINLGFAEYDRPRTRSFSLKDAVGTVLCEGMATSGVTFAEAKPATSNAWDEQVFTLEVSDGPGEYRVQCALLSARPPTPTRSAGAALQAFFAPDQETAAALKGGVIYADGQRFYLPQQVRLHQWLKTLGSNDFEVAAKTVKLAPAGYSTSPAYDLTPNRNAEFRPLNGPHEPAPIADTIMFSYDLHKNRQALNVAIQSVAMGLRLMGPGDYPVSSTWKGMDNLAYRFGTYGWHWWRPGWRILQQSDAPAEVKEILRESFINAADRLACTHNGERVNGNSFATVVCALRYAVEATGDPLVREQFETYYHRFTTGGWGARVGVGPTGLIQEEFAYEHHYGSYSVATWGAVAEDLKDERFIRVLDGIKNVYSYTLNNEVDANPFSARTAHGPAFKPEKEGRFAWKGFGGPDLTESINGANEFFAARRKGYYILTYHGRATPKWQNEGFMGQIGWSGGTICQMVVPGKGTVLAGTLNKPGYGKDNHPSQWRGFHIHSLVGQTADGKPLISSDSEHLDARLTGNTVTSSGEVRESSVVATRSYTYNPDHVVAEVKLRMTDDDGFLSFWFKSPFRGYVTEAWEMIPFVGKTPAVAKEKKPEVATQVTLLDATGKELGALDATPREGQTVVIDRGGYGVRVELEKPTPVMRGINDTVMIQAITPSAIGPRDPAKEAPNAGNVALRYKLVPFGE